MTDNERFHRIFLWVEAYLQGWKTWASYLPSIHWRNIVKLEIGERSSSPPERWDLPVGVILILAANHLRGTLNQLSVQKLSVILDSLQATPSTIRGWEQVHIPSFTSYNLGRGRWSVSDSTIQNRASVLLFYRLTRYPAPPLENIFLS